MSEKFTIARSLRQHVANNARYEIVRAGWSRTASTKHELRTHGEQRSTLFERGSVCSIRLTSTLPHSPVSRCLTVSLSLCVPCGWRPVSECTPLLLSLPTLFKHSLLRTTSATPVPCPPANQRPRLPTTRRLHQRERNGGCSTCPLRIAWITDEIMRAGRQPDLRTFDEVRRAQLRNIPLAQYPTGCRATAPDHHVPTAASRCSSLMSCQLSVCHTFDTYRRVSRDGLIFFHFFLSLFSSLSILSSYLWIRLLFVHVLILFSFYFILNRDRLIYSFLYFTFLSLCVFFFFFFFFFFCFVRICLNMLFGSVNRCISSVFGDSFRRNVRIVFLKLVAILWSAEVHDGAQRRGRTKLRFWLHYRFVDLFLTVDFSRRFSLSIASYAFLLLSFVRSLNFRRNFLSTNKISLWQLLCTIRFFLERYSVSNPRYKIIYFFNFLSIFRIWTNVETVFQLIENSFIKRIVQTYCTKIWITR